MGKEVTPDVSQIQNPVEWIIKQRKMAEAQVSAPKEVIGLSSLPPTALQKKSNIPVVSWAGQDLNEEALTMLFYMIVKEVSKDKKIKKYLKDLNIEIYNINDELLWP